MVDRALAVGLDRLCVNFKEPQRWAQWLPIYTEALDDLSPELIELAVKRCIRNLDFFPKPAEFRRQIAEEIADDLARLAEEQNRARREQQYLPPPSREPMTAEERAEFGDKMEAYWREMGGRPKPRAALPPQSDGTGWQSLPDLAAALADYRARFATNGAQPDDDTDLVHFRARFEAAR